MTTHFLRKAALYSRTSPSQTWCHRVQTHLESAQLYNKSFVIPSSQLESGRAGPPVQKDVICPLQHTSYQIKPISFTSNVALLHAARRPCTLCRHTSLSCSSPVSPHGFVFCGSPRAVPLPAELFSFPLSSPSAAKVRTQDFPTPVSSLFHQEDLPPSHVDHFHFLLGRDAVTGMTENGEGLLGTASIGH